MKSVKILVFSSDPSVITPLKVFGDVHSTADRSAFLKKLNEEKDTCVVLDEDIAGKVLDLYRDAARILPSIKTMIVSSSATIPQAVEAAKLGVLDYVKKPLDAGKLSEAVNEHFLKDDEPHIALHITENEPWLFGHGAKLKSMFSAVSVAIQNRGNIVFTAADGIDVMSLAKRINDISGGGRKLAFMDMSQYRAENLETIFWTVLQEALTDAGTVYFKNIHLMDAKLAKSVEDYIKSKALRGHIRVIGQALKHEAGEPEMAVLEGWTYINVPSLRDRKEDLPAMLDGYLKLFSAKHAKEVKNISLDLLNLFSNYGWSGNYRELECSLENAVLACDEDTLTLKHFAVGSRMVYEDIAGRGDRLLDLKMGIEKSLVNVFSRKTSSPDMVASLLDVPKERVEKYL
jgi:DNA-binding NtrC family response regulator